MSSLRVVSYNVRNGKADDGEDSWPLRRRRTAQMLRDLDFDLAGLQEPFDFQIEDLKTALAEYGFLGVARDDGDREGEYAPIVYRKSRFELIDSGTFWFSDTPEAPGSASWGNECVRICTWATLSDAESGSHLTHFNAHLDHESQPSRERSAELLLSHANQAKGPVIVTGDFNADEDNPAIRRMIDGGLTDTYRSIHPETEEVGTFCGFRDSFDPEKIDYIFASPHFCVKDAEIIRRKIDGRWPSDHAVVVAVLEREAL